MRASGIGRSREAWVFLVKQWRGEGVSLGLNKQGLGGRIIYLLANGQKIVVAQGKDNLYREELSSRTTCLCFRRLDFWLFHW